MQDVRTRKGEQYHTHIYMSFHLLSIDEISILKLLFLSIEVFDELYRIKFVDANLELFYGHNNFYIL